MLQGRTRAAKIITVFVFLSLVLSIGYTIVRIVQTPSTLGADPLHDKTRSDYVLMLMQCCLGIVAMLLPGWISKKWRIEIPSVMLVMYVLFLYAAIYLGEVRSFYYKVPHFDTILHAFSGGMLGALAFSFIVLLNKAEKVPVNLSPAFVALFAFSFGMMLGVLWEIYEYTLDGILGLNMQKYLLEDGTALVGHEALADTMKDFIVNALGGLVTAVVGYISLKHKKGWVEKLIIRRQKKA